MELKKTKYLFFCGMIIFIFWTITTILLKNNVNPNIFNFIEGIELIIISLIVFFLFTLQEDCFYVLPWFCFVPFVFSHPFNAVSTPIFLFIALFISVLGAIIHLAIYKFKYQKGNLLWGLVTLGISLVLGGLFNKSTYSSMQIIISLIAVGAFIWFYIFLVSTTKPINFNDICYLMISLSIILLLQTYTFYFLEGNLFETFSHKNLDVGWGISNNVALMLLSCMPFSFYLIFKNKQRILMIIIFFLQFTGILFSYSRGCIFFAILGSICFLIISLVSKDLQKKEKRNLLFSVLIYFVFLVCLFLSFNLLSPGFWNEFKRLTFGGIHFDSFNGRLEIYKELLSKSFNHPVFGHGILYPIINSSNSSYLWGHNTFLHTLYTLGIFGVLTLIFHFIEKYYCVIKKMNYEKFTLFLFFLLSDLYGLIDVSYFFINYMIVLIVVFILANNYFNKIRYNKNERNIK